MEDWISVVEHASKENCSHWGLVESLQVNPASLLRMPKTLPSDTASADAWL